MLSEIRTRRPCDHLGRHDKSVEICLLLSKLGWWWDLEESRTRESTTDCGLKRNKKQNNWQINKSGCGEGAYYWRKVCCSKFVGCEKIKTVNPKIPWTYMRGRKGGLVIIEWILTSEVWRAWIQEGVWLGSRLCSEFYSKDSWITLFFLQKLLLVPEYFKCSDVQQWEATLSFRLEEKGLTGRQPG